MKSPALNRFIFCYQNGSEAVNWVNDFFVQAHASKSLVKYLYFPLQNHQKATVDL